MLWVAVVTSFSPFPAGVCVSLSVRVSLAGRWECFFSPGNLSLNRHNPFWVCSGMFWPGVGGRSGLGQTWHLFQTDGTL